MIPMNYLTKVRKYLMFVGIRKVGCQVDKEWIIFLFFMRIFMLILFFLAVF